MIRDSARSRLTRSGRLRSEHCNLLAVAEQEASMNTVLQRPLLVGGIGLTLGLWGLDSVSHSLPGMGDLFTLGAMAAGGGYWWYSRRNSEAPLS